MRTDWENAEQTLRRYWHHCARCSLHMERCRVDSKQGKEPVGVAPSISIGAPHRPGIPHLLHIMLPCPDLEQFQAGTLNPMADGQPLSPVLRLLTESLNALRDSLPEDMTVRVSTSLGCRPINHDQPRGLIEPAPAWLKACRPRWHAEEALADAHLTLALGKHSVAALRPDLKKSWRNHLGGVIPFEVSKPWDPASTLTRCAFVGHAPEDVILQEPAFGWRADKWDGGHPSSFHDAPFHTWLWHLLTAAWLADTLRTCTIGRTLDNSLWPHIVAAITAHFQKVEDSGDTEGLAERIRRSVQEEINGQGARHLQRHGDFTLEVDDEDEDGDEEDGDDDSDD